MAQAPFTPDVSALATTRPAAPTLRDWERLMHRARHRQLAGQSTAALQLTQEALTLARGLLTALAGPPDDCVAAWVVSQHNMAFLRQQAGLPEEAARHLCEAHYKLMALLIDPSASPALQQAAWRHSRETHTALLQFQQDLATPALAPEHAPAIALASQALQAHANLARHCGETAH